MQNKLSIIVPVYNAEKFIDRCMRSIYAQTFKDYEIILVNDGSKDNSAKICKKYAEKDKRIIFIDKDNGGAGSARNAGIEKASGEYLAFPDVDDWFEPDMYEELYKKAKSGDFDMVFSGVNNYTNFKGELKYKSTETCGDKEYFNKEDCRKNVMEFFPTTTIFDVPWNKLYKREVAIKNNVRFADTRRCQDAMFNIDFYNASDKIASVDKAFYNYIENTQEAVDRKFPKNYIDIVVIYCSHLKEILTGWNMYNGHIRTHYDTTFVLGVFSAINMFDNPKWGLNKKEKTEYVSDILNRKDVENFLSDVSVREDAKKIYNVIKNKNIKAIFKIHRKEKLKDVLRNNRFLITMYRFLKGKNK